MEKWQLESARRQSELELLEILTELGAEIQYQMRPSNGESFAFQAFWPERVA